MASGMNDMAANGFDPIAQYARLSERVENQGKDIVDLRSNMNTGFQSVNSNLASLSNELRSNSKTQWPVIWSAAGVCFTVLAALGAFFYGTLSKGQDRLDAAIVKSAEIQQASISELSKAVVPRQEMEWRQARSSEDRQRTEANVKDLRDSQVPRAELTRVFSGYDQRFADMQRQLDEQKQQAGSVYGVRDILLDLRQRMDRVERERIAGP